MTTNKKSNYEKAEDKLIETVTYMTSHFNLNTQDIIDIIRDRCEDE